jgi:hypothetical protein
MVGERQRCSKQPRREPTPTALDALVSEDAMQRHDSQRCSERAAWKASVGVAASERACSHSQLE